MTNVKNIDEILSATIKANLILSDYTLATDKEEKNIYLNLLERYIMALDDPTITLYYTKVVDSVDNKEKEIYIEILMDLLGDHNI